MSDLLLSFYGDDFTGSTDAMESLARGGVQTVLFTEPPTPARLARYPGLQAFGVAGMTRAMGPDEMERTLRAAFAELHPYKVPELLALPVEAGLDKYLEWINGETTLALT